MLFFFEVYHNQMKFVFALMKFQCSSYLDIFVGDCDLGQYITYVSVDVKVYAYRP
jgi:hypothetical protein